MRWQLVLVVLAACGRVADDTASDASADAVSDVGHHLDASSDVADEESDTSTDAFTVDGAPVCEDGIYYVTVVDDAGTHVFDGGCDDAGVPDVTDVGRGMKIICESVSACNAGSIRVVGFGAPGVANVAITYAADGDASRRTTSKRTIANWPPVGGTVSGVFAGAAFDGGPSVAGSFCVLRR
jgi:hypothetical protein